MDFLLTIIINAVAVWLGAQFLRGVEVTDFSRAVIIGLVLSVLNATLGSFLDWISTPIRWITLGLFSFVVDAIILMVTDYFLKGLKITNFWWALALAIIVGVVNSITHAVIY
ncbi:MAG: phage holin family protein [Saprospiraceae bacterium]|nr:MAG: phage holin family protein [Saprospiraceae bacterium]